MTLATFVLATFLSAQLVSLDTTDMVMSDFLRFIAKAANLNLVIHPDVDGNVNVFVKDVPWEQVLDSVLKVHGLEKEVDGNTMRIAPAASLPLRPTCITRYNYTRKSCSYCRTYAFSARLRRGLPGTKRLNRARYSPIER